MRKKNANIINNQSPFPWIAFAWAAEKYGYYLNIVQIGAILGVNKKEASKILSVSNVSPVTMSGGKSLRYEFSDLPEIVRKFREHQQEQFSKLSE